MSTTGDIVVIGIDGSEDGRRAMHYGLAMAEREDLSVRLVHVPQTDMYAPHLLETTAPGHRVQHPHPAAHRHLPRRGGPDPLRPREVRQRP
jgi:nucleotide-binding universal stress UspA family protein